MKFTSYVLTSLLLISSASATDQDEKTEKQNKSIRIVVEEVLYALSKEKYSIAADVSDVPWYSSGSAILEDKQKLKKHISVIFEGKSAFYETCEIKKIETFESAKKHLSEVEISNINIVLSDKDFIVTVESTLKDKTKKIFFALKFKDNKYWFVGISS